MPSSGSRRGELRALVATASLELGIDIGDVDLVCQLGTPRSIAAFLQRVGRANHAVGGVPKGRLLPLSRDELVECTALLDAVRRGELDALQMPAQPLDVLAQQLVAEVGCARIRRGRAVRAGAPGVALSRARRAPSSTSWCACSPKASPRGAAGRAPTCTATPSTAACAAGAARGSPPSPAAARFPTTPTTRWCSSPRAPSSAR